MRRVVALLVLVAFIASGCGDDGAGRGIGPVGPGPSGADIDDDDDRIEGSGTVVTEVRDVEGFDRVALAGEGAVVITHGDTESLEVTTDDNLLELTETVVVDGTLEIRAPAELDIDPTEAHFEVVVESLAGVEVSGAGDVTIDRFSADDASIVISGVADVDVGELDAGSLAVDVGGVGTVTAEGAVGSQVVTLTGVGEYHAGDLASAEATIDVGGTSEATIWVTDSLRATISGVGRLAYYGEPEVESDVGDEGELTALGQHPDEPATDPPEPVCEEAAVFAVVDSAIVDARLAAGGPWTTDPGDNAYAVRTVSGDVLADRFGLDCGVTAVSTSADGVERFVIAAWTGPRMAFLVQTPEAPASPYVPFANFQFVTEEVRGEFVRDDQTLWAGVLEDRTTVLVGHVDYNLGPMAKEWQLEVPVPPDAEPTNDTELDAIGTLEAAGQRNVAVAQEAEPGSELGTIMFVSTTGQINVVAVSPEGWFDPMVPLSLSGPTTTMTIDGIEVRITAPAPDDLFYPRGGEVGWWCGEYSWIIEPPINGTLDEMVDVARAVIATGACETSQG